ncbi:hypothetical protein AMJ86_00915 [bacterium SM23_57]|nr:MAG: hypothetical protein AMJ86_00915 [bacterium SM23_57]
MKRWVGIGLILTIFACESLTEIDLDCLVWHATNVIRLESDLLGEKDDVTVHLSWRWLLTRPSSGSVVVERSIGNMDDFTLIATVTPIETVMTYLDRDTILQPNTTAFYRLGLFDGTDTDYFDTLEVTIPPVQHFYEPAQDTVGNDTLRLIFAQLPGFNDCEVSVYNAFVTDPESLMNLLNPIFVDTLTYPDTSLVLPIPDAIYPDTTIYTIRLLSLNEVEVSGGNLTSISSTISSGFRAFFKKPPFPF